jgi:hypothetical protein
MMVSKTDTEVSRPTTGDNTSTIGRDLPNSHFLRREIITNFFIDNGGQLFEFPCHDIGIQG